MCFPDWYLNSKDAEDRLLRVCEGRALVVFDSLRAGTPGSKENDSEQRQYLDLITRVSEKTGATTLVLAHDDKGGHAMRGSSAQNDALGSAVQALKKDKAIQLLQVKASVGAGGSPRTLRFVDEGGLIEGYEMSERLVIKNESGPPGAGELVSRWNEAAEGLRANEAAARVALDALAKSESLTQSALLGQMNCRRQVGVEVLRGLLAEGRIADEMRGRSRYYKLVPPAPANDSKGEDEDVPF